MQTKVVTLTTIVCLFLAGCIHKTGGAVTPWERVTTYNAVLAQANNTVEQGAETLAASSVITQQQAREVITYTAQVAGAHLQVTALLAKGSAITADDTSALSQLLLQIQSSGSAMVRSGNLGIKNPKSQQTISADISGIVSAAQAIVNLLPDLIAQPAPPNIPRPPAPQT
jgi:hypothetical protein